MPWAKFPEVNADIFYDVSFDVDTNKESLSVIESVNNLSDHFAYEYEVLADCPPGENKLIDKLLGLDLGWEDWVIRGDLQEHKSRVRA